MAKIHFITGSSNKTKLGAVKSVLMEVPFFEFIFTAIFCDQKESKPLSRLKTFQVAAERTSALLEEYLKKEENKEVLVYGIEFQKGVNIQDVDQTLVLICQVCIMSNDTTKIVMASTEISLDEKIRTLVLQGIELYEAYGIVYGEKVKNKELTIYELLTGKSESHLFEETLKKGLVF